MSDMKYLTYEEFVEGGGSGKPRSFNCHSCGGFQYLKPVFFGFSNAIAICEECYRNQGTQNNPVNYGMDTAVPAKPQQKGHTIGSMDPQTLDAVVRRYWENHYKSFATWDEFIRLNGGTVPAVAEQIRKYDTQRWRLYYHEITGNIWRD